MTDRGSDFGPPPLPDLEETEYARPFWEAANEGQFVLQYCEECDRHQYFPRPWCTSCGGTIEWVEASGEGTVYSYAIVRRTVSNPAFEGAVPYVTAYVDLQEGPRLFTRLVNCDPEAIDRGTPVAVTFEEGSDGRALPLFEPRE